MATYCNTLTRESYDEPDYALIDTLFSLAEAYLFAQLVEFKDNHSYKFPLGTEYVVLLTTFLKLMKSMYLEIAQSQQTL